MSEHLARLARLAGIETEYWDIFGNHYQVDDEARRRLLAAMGIAADGEDIAAQSLRDLEEAPWRRTVEPVTVLRDALSARVTVTTDDSGDASAVRWSLHLEDGRVLDGTARGDALTTLAARDIDGVRRLRRELRLPADLPLGYHRLEAEAGGRGGAGRLVVAPRRAFLPDWLRRGERHWGLACHLYAVRRETDWGIGDFTTLERMADMGAETGAQALGLNPLHAMFAGWPDHASPYSPSSRLFLNPLFVDVEAVPEFDAVRGRLPRALSAELAKARTARHVDYQTVSELKTEIFGRMFETLRRQGGARWDAFEAFTAEAGPTLRTFCLFEALSERFEGDPWREWPDEFRRPDSPRAESFARDNAERMNFHAYQQWLADGQLGAAARRTAERGMSVGLYRDLAVGVAQNGAEAWTDQDVIVEGMQFGAPGDAMNPLGQAWGAPPYRPLALRDAAYAPFINVLRANMRHAGALRIDHVMSLQHLFWIPNGADARSGAYVAYPMDDLVGIVALESHRNRCLVIGEDLGTVPDGFRDRMSEESILSYKVVYFERWPNGLFKRPDAYPDSSLATPTTHDLPTLLGHWEGADLALRREIGVFENEDRMKADEDARRTELELLHAALVDQELLPADFPRFGPLDPDQEQRFIEAANRFAARTSSALAMINLDDLAGEKEQLNMPGTVLEYPNWRRRIAPTIEDLSFDDKVRAQAAAINAERQAREPGADPGA